MPQAVPLLPRMGRVWRQLADIKKGVRGLGENLRA